MDVEIQHQEGIRDGDRAVIKMGLGPIDVTWVAEHRDYVEGRQFRDIQVKGPFESWEHLHRFEPAGYDATFLIDQISFSPPFGQVGELSESQIRHRLDRQFTYRHRITGSDLALHRRYSRGNRLKIAVTGSSGLIGTNLIAFLKSGGHEVRRVVRSKPEPGSTDIFWHQRQGEIEAEKLEGLDAVIHLAGENVFALRWTQQKKMRIYTSRVRGTALISRTLAGLKNPPRVFISASAVGYYGDRGDEVLTEQSEQAKSGFFPAVCREWEKATRFAAEAGIRTVRLRTGLGVTPRGGALGIMLPPFQVGLGGYIGSGEQYMSWVAMDDLLGAIYHTIHTETLEGPVNLVSPNPVRMKSFVRTLGRVLSRPAFFSVPSVLVKTAMGKAADEMLLLSTRVVPEKLQNSGYTFLYPELEDALRHQLGYYRFEKEAIDREVEV